VSSLPEKQTRWLPTVHRGMWRCMSWRAAASLCLAPTFLTLCASSATWYKNMAVLLCKRIPVHEFIG